jgi:ribonuclease Z
MGQVIVLGSGYAVPDDLHDNTHLLIREGSHTILVDAASNPIQRLRHAGVAFDDLTDLILTHFHPDHVSGVPLLLMGMWLLGRKLPLHIHGLKHTLDRTNAMIDLYDLRQWGNFYPIEFHEIPEEEMSRVIDAPDLRITSSPVKHYIPTIGLRIEFIKENKAIAYSCDTEPCPQVARLGKNVDALIHEATGATSGHSSSRQAAEIAEQAGAKTLYLIHYPSDQHDLGLLLDEAQKEFKGPVYLAQDFMSLAF